MDGRLALSLLEYFDQDVYMVKILSLYEEDIDNLSYHDNDSSPPLKKDLPKGSKRN